MLTTSTTEKDNIYLPVGILKLEPNLAVILRLCTRPEILKMYVRRKDNIFVVQALIPLI